MTEIVKLDPREFGLEENKAKEIAAQFKPMLEKMEELEAEYNEVIKLPIDDPETAVKAKEIRLKYVKVRTGTAEIHKQQKAFYLAGGRFVDGWKNAQLFASQGIEDRLKEIETHQERLEAERKEKVRAARWVKLEPYMETEPYGLAQMEEDVFNNLLAGAKAAHDQRIEAERKAEAERIERERLDKREQQRRVEIAPYLQFAKSAPEIRELSDTKYDELLTSLKKAKAEYDAEQEKIRQENERLRKDAEAERERQAAIEAKRKAQEEKDRKEREEKARKEREAYEAKLKKERDERAAIEAEMQARKDAEEKAKKEEAERQRQKELAPDKDKLINLKADIKAISIPTLTDKAAQDIAIQVNGLLEKTTAYLESKIKSL